MADLHANRARGDTAKNMILAGVVRKIQDRSCIATIDSHWSVWYSEWLRRQWHGRLLAQSDGLLRIPSSELKSWARASEIERLPSLLAVARAMTKAKTMI